MGRGDNRRTPKHLRRKAQEKKKARLKRKIETAKLKASKKPKAPAQKQALESAE